MVLTDKDMLMAINRVEAIIVMMKRKGLNKNDLAKKLGVSRQTVSATLRKKNISQKTFDRYAQAIGLELITIVKEGEL